MNTTKAIALLGASLFFMPFFGCEKSEPAPAAATQAPAPDTYADILGVVTTLPVAGQPGSELKIHHEHIPGFKTKDGVVNVSADGVRGMKSMTMPFPVGEGVSLEGIEVGDKVRFTFAVNWGGSPPWEVTRIEEVPADTEIDFANKADPDAHDHADHNHSGHGHADDDHSGHDHGDHDGHDHGSP